jgi:hypothetical protein
MECREGQACLFRVLLFQLSQSLVDRIKPAHNLLVSIHVFVLGLDQWRKSDATLKQ